MKNFLLGTLIFICLVQPAFGGSYFVFQDHSGTWHDADKDYRKTQDSLMCWAAAAANVLKWGRWDTSDLNTESKIFDYFKYNWTNGVGSPAVAVEWWLNGEYNRPHHVRTAHGKGSRPLSSEKDRTALRLGSDAGNYRPSYHYRNYLHEDRNPATAMNTIADLLRSGCGVIVGLQKEGKPSGHVVTAWGFETDEQGNLKGLYITNSDDGAHTLSFSPVDWDAGKGRWSMGTADQHVKQVWGLEPRTPAKRIDEPLPVAGAVLSGPSGRIHGMM